MTFHNFHGDEDLVNSVTKLLNTHGVYLTIGYDFRIFKALLKDAFPDRKLGKMFDPDSHELDDGDAFWLIGQTADGEIIHTQAMRILKTGPRNLADFMSKRFKDFAPAGMSLDMERSHYRVGPGARRMSGRIAYCGEYWIGGKPGQFRGTGLSYILSRYVWWQTLQHWDPDHIISFIAQNTAMKGFVERASMMHTEPNAITMYPAGSDKEISGFLCYLHREDLHYLLDIPLQTGLAAAA
jgi:hypothetical protein